VPFGAYAQANVAETKPEYYMYQLDIYGMTGNKEIFLKGAITFKNIINLIIEHRNVINIYANKITQAIKKEKNTEKGENNNDEEDKDYEAVKSSDTMHCFDCSTS
jgi:hypothetical protein